MFFAKLASEPTSCIADLIIAIPSAGEADASCEPPAILRDIFSEKSAEAISVLGVLFALGKFQSGPSVTLPIPRPV